MGIGDGLIPPILDRSLIRQIEIVTDEEAIETTRSLTRREGILCGISSGTNVCVALLMARLLGLEKKGGQPHRIIGLVRLPRHRNPSMVQQ